jgi:tetratricopeptide (TPR) repeat protein
VLEDDVSTTGFDDSAPARNQHTVLNGASVNRTDGSSPKATSPQSMRSPGTATKRRALLWFVAAASVLIVCGVLFTVARHIYRQTHTEIVTAPPPPPPPPEPSPPPQPSAEDTTRKMVDQHLADARDQMAAGDYTGAVRDHVQPALDLDPGNTDALELKQRAEAAITAAPPTPKPPRVVTSPVQPVAVEIETPGISRRANEAYADYTVRAKRIEVDLAEGKSSLDKKDYVAAINRFRAVDREQPRYQGVDLLITDAKNKQQKAFEEAMDNGLQSERAERWKVARQWYQTASHVDPTSTSAREKAETIRNRTFADAKKLETQASLARKIQETETAVRYYQQIVDLLLPGDEMFDNAKKELEALKR